ncbi:MAG: DUF2905 domain-containing protein [Chlorobium sp.]
MFSDLGKIVTVAGLVIVFVGLLLMTSDKTGFWHWFNWFGKLPFDFKIVKDNFSFYFPMGTSVVLSVLLSLILFLVNKFIR